MERIELVKASCQHYIPRPPGWPDGTGSVIATPFTLQATLDETAERLGTPYFERNDIKGFGEVRQPVVLCPECTVRVGRLLTAAAEMADLLADGRVRVLGPPADGAVPD